MLNIFKKKKSHAEEVQEELLRELEEERKAKEEAGISSYSPYSSSNYYNNQPVTSTEDGGATNTINEADSVVESASTGNESVKTDDFVSTNDNSETSIESELKANVTSDNAEVAAFSNSETSENTINEEITADNSVENNIDNTADNSIVNELDETEAVAEEIKNEGKKGFFAKLKEGLTKTRNNIVSGMDSLFSSDDKIDDDFYEELEEILILGDIGVHTTDDILEKLKKEVKENHIKKRTDCKAFLIQSIKEAMAIGDAAYEFETKKSVVFVIGVNGVGKTTSIGKLAALLKAQGKRVMMGACDTFRAAAGSQLEEWSHRAGVEMIGGKEGQDPSSVLFDAVTAAKARDVDVLLVDTAGRLHNKKNLMEELKKMNRVIDKVYPEVHRENLIVLDASTGQNALNQAIEFGEVADLTGIILTKMDGTAKGGIAIAITSELQVPVKYIGVGERIVDLQKFNPETFVDALFDVDLTDEVLHIDGNDDTSNDEENAEKLGQAKPDMED